MASKGSLARRPGVGVMAERRDAVPVVVTFGTQEAGGRLSLLDGVRLAMGGDSRKA